MSDRFSGMRRSWVMLFGCVLLGAGCGDGGGFPPGPDIGGGVIGPDTGAGPIPTGTPPVGAQAALGGCPMFPPDNEWNRDISGDPVDGNSAGYMALMNAGTRKLHPDFGSDPTYGIPWVSVPPQQPLVPIQIAWADESDPGPYPMPLDVPIEGGDRHALVLQRGACKLYETFATARAGAGFVADAGAVFDLRKNGLRPDGWTSADAAGLPILPGLVRRDEIRAGVIPHALRFTVQKTQQAYVAPATHQASARTDPNLPPMGLRVRLKAGFDISTYKGAARVILQALKRYGMFVADNGGDWYISGETNPTWDDDDLDQLKAVPASAFEVVKHGPLKK